jgi:hypothetical protein
MGCGKLFPATEKIKICGESKTKVQIQNVEWKKGIYPTVLSLMLKK